HIGLLVQRGVTFLEHLVLSPLAADGVKECLLVVAPLLVTGGTGSPINRIAESQELMESGFMTWPTMSDDARESLTETLTAGAQVGQHVRLLALQTPEEGGFSLV